MKHRSSLRLTAEPITAVKQVRHNRNASTTSLNLDAAQLNNSAQCCVRSKTTRNRSIPYRTVRREMRRHVYHYHPARTSHMRAADCIMPLGNEHHADRRDHKARLERCTTVSLRSWVTGRGAGFCLACVARRRVEQTATRPLVRESKKDQERWRGL